MKNMFSKLLAFFVVCVLAVSFVACRNNDDDDDSSSDSGSNGTDPFLGTVWINTEKRVTLKFYNDKTSELDIDYMGIPNDEYKVSQSGNTFTAICALNNVFDYTFKIDSSDATTGVLKQSLLKIDGKPVDYVLTKK